MIRAKSWSWRDRVWPIWETGNLSGKREQWGECYLTCLLAWREERENTLFLTKLENWKLPCSLHTPLLLPFPFISWSSYLPSFLPPSPLLSGHSLIRQNGYLNPNSIRPDEFLQYILTITLPKESWLMSSLLPFHTRPAPASLWFGSPYEMSPLADWGKGGSQMVQSMGTMTEGL